MRDAHPKYFSVFLDRLTLSVATLELLDPQQHEGQRRSVADRFAVLVALDTRRCEPWF